jgi:hypothetical protein
MGSHDGRMAAQTLDYHAFVGIQYIYDHAQKWICARAPLSPVLVTFPFTGMVYVVHR